MYERPYVLTPTPKTILPEWVARPRPRRSRVSRTLIGTGASRLAPLDLRAIRHHGARPHVATPGGDAAVVRIPGTKKAIAISCDVTPRYVKADPRMGTIQAVVETWRNITAVGGEGLAITDNMNFANPERPEIMGQFVGSCEGMKEACLALKYPVVSGNVSLYNETQGVGIPPTPAIGGVGLIPDWTKTASIALKNDGDVLVLIGREQGHLGQSLYQLHRTGKTEGAPPPVDLNDEIKAGNLVRALIREGKTTTVHDVSDGGLVVAVAEMALAGNIGVALYPYEGKLPGYATWFGEDQGRYVVAVAPIASRRRGRTRQAVGPADAHHRPRWWHVARSERRSRSAIRGPAQLP